MKYRAAFVTNMVGLAGMQAFRADISDARVLVLAVVPVKEASKEALRVLDASE